MSIHVRTSQDLLKFAIHLAEVRFAGLRGRGLQLVRKRLASALGRDSASHGGVRAGVMVSHRFDGLSPDRYGLANFAHLQAEVARLLESVAGGAQRQLKPIVPGPIRVLTLPYQGRTLLFIEGTVEAVFLHVLLFALSQADNSIVRRCPVCTRIFAALGQRRYCERRCTNRASRMKYMARHGREQLLLAKRSAYEKRVKPGRARPYKPRRSTGVA